MSSISNHVLSQMKPKEKGFNVQAASESCLVYLTGEIVTRNSHRPAGKGNRTTKCTCMRKLLNKLPILTDVARYMIGGQVSIRQPKESYYTNGIVSLVKTLKGNG